MLFIRTQINLQAHGYRCSFYPVKGFIVSIGKRENQLRSILTKTDRWVQIGKMVELNKNKIKGKMIMGEYRVEQSNIWAIIGE